MRTRADIVSTLLVGLGLYLVAASVVLLASGTGTLVVVLAWSVALLLVVASTGFLAYAGRAIVRNHISLSVARERKRAYHDF